MSEDKEGRGVLQQLGQYAYDPGKASPRRAQRGIPKTGGTEETEPSRITPVKRKGKERASNTDDDNDGEYQDAGPSGTRSASTPKRKPLAQSAQTPSPSPLKRKARPFAGPEVYAHLNPVTDHLKPNLNIIFCGINPGKMSSTLGHHFAHPTNKFWKSLFHSGITDRQVPPSEDQSMPDLYNFGLTNLCDRPTSEQSELSNLEMKLNVYSLTMKIQRFRPRVVCFVGKKIWDIYESVISKTAGPPVEIHMDERDPVEDRRKLEGEVKLDLEPMEEDNDDLTGMTVSLVNVDSSGKIKLEPPDPMVTRTTPYDIKEEEAEEPLVEVELRSEEEERSATLGLDEQKPEKPEQRSKKQPKSRPTPMDWTKPRGFRLQHEHGYTYFWVTPNTSGLERTPLSEQIIIFSHLKAFVDGLIEGQLEGVYRDIDVRGVKNIVDAIQANEEAKKMKRAEVKK